MHTADPTPDAGRPIWTPGARRRERAVVTAFERWLADRRGLRFACYDDLWQWSVDDVEGFWTAIRDFFDLKATLHGSVMLADARMPGARWMPGTRLNIVDQFLRHGDASAPAIVWESEAIGEGAIGWPQLRDQVGALAAALRAMGVEPGDRVAAMLPNVPHTVIAFLAVASLGAVWSLCAPDMGPASIADRFRQIEPKVLIACDGYRYGGRDFDRRETVAAVLGHLPTVEHLLQVPLMGLADPPMAAGAPPMTRWADALSGAARVDPVPMPADAPLWILYSSGTTGLPKAIVHGHGGILVNGLVSIVLHADLHPGDRIMWAVNTSWMVWNAHVLSLIGGATIVLYDGAITGPGPAPDWSFVWRLAHRHALNVLGVGAAVLHACMKQGLRPGELVDLGALETISSTGSPLSPQAYAWVHRDVKADVWLNSVSGGTDIAAGFLVGLPTLPVYPGEMQCRALGARVEAFDEAGRPVIDEVGELVCTQPVPSMPLRFWADPGDLRQIESYFDMFHHPDGSPIWRHGDWLRLVPREGATGGVIYGRSDATINRQGIRMGTAELYRAVEAIDEVLDSMVVDLEYLGRASRMVLFVVLRPGVALAEPLDRRIRDAIRAALSPRHVPDDIVPVDRIPKTLTGKKLELPVKKLMLGHAVEKVVTRDALADPDAIDWYVAFAARHLASTGATVPS